MKKFIILYVCVSLYSLSYSQDFSQLGTKATISIEDQTYEVLSTGYRLMINNTANVKSDELLKWNDGRIVEEDEYISLDLGTLNLSSMYQAIRETFTKEEFEELKAGNDRIELFLQNTPDGRVIEVGLYVRITPRTLALFPSRAKVFEDNIKQYVHYTTGEDNHRLPSWRSFHQINFGDLGHLYIDKTKQDPDLDGVAIGGL